MANNLNPPKIIFINDNLSSGVLEQLQKQLAISEIQTKEQFDGYCAADPDGYYTEHQIAADKRILVLCDLITTTDRTLADIVLCYRGGLLYIEESKYNAPGKSLILDHAYIRALII